MLDACLEPGAVHELGPESRLAFAEMLARAPPDRRRVAARSEIGDRDDEAARGEHARDRLLAASEPQRAGARPQHARFRQRLEHVGELPELAVEHHGNPQFRAPVGGPVALEIGLGAGLRHQPGGRIGEAAAGRQFRGQAPGDLVAEELHVQGQGVERLQPERQRAEVRPRRRIGGSEKTCDQRLDRGGADLAHQAAACVGVRSAASRATRSRPSDRRVKPPSMAPVARRMRSSTGLSGSAISKSMGKA